MDNHNALEQAWLNGYKQGRQAVEKSGPIDVAVVVHCRDCRWYGTNFPNPIPPACHRSDGLLCVEENEYCSRGERRTDG